MDSYVDSQHPQSGSDVSQIHRVDETKKTWKDPHFEWINQLHLLNLWPFLIAN